MKRLTIILCMLASVLAMISKTITLADPTIFYADGIYYLTGTGDADNGFAMYFSTDLIHWERCGYAAGGRALYKDDTFGTSMFWAPQVFEYEGSYYMAYAANEQIAIAKAKSPEGPYKQTKIAELPHTTGQIDPYVFIDDDGKKYIYYVRFIGGNTLYVGELTDDFTSIKEGTITKCLEAADGTWEHMKHITDTKITEGPTVIKEGEYYFLIYSANHFEDIDYAVGYAYSRSPKGPWTKVGRPFISRHNTGVNGSGHGDMFKDEEGNWFYVFHTHATNTNVGIRRTALVPITLTDDHRNKFIPEVDRMIFLDDAAPEDAMVPEPATKFEVDGICYEVTNAENNDVKVTFRDAVKFGGYSKDIAIPEKVAYEGVTYNVTELGTSAFYKCTSLTSVQMPQTVKTIGIGAFEGSPLTTVTIPQNVISVGYRAFAENSKLNEVISCRRTAPSAVNDSFSQTTYNNATLIVNTGSKKYYAGSTGWKNFAQIVEVEDTGIDDIDVAHTGATVYNLAGQRMPAMNLPGIYVVNGKKVIVK